MVSSCARGGRCSGQAASVTVAAQDVAVVAEDGGDLDGAADGLDVAGDSVDGRYLAALDLGDAALGHAHPLGDLRLGQPEGLAALGEPVAAVVGPVAVPCLGDGLLAAGPGDDAVADVLQPPSDLPCSSAVVGQLRIRVHVPVGVHGFRPGARPASLSRPETMAAGLHFRNQVKPGRSVRGAVRGANAASRRAT